jgi:glycerol kinase
MESDTQMELSRLMVDGGMTSNQFVCTILSSDLLNKEVVIIEHPDVSALGAAYLAG